MEPYRFLAGLLVTINLNISNFMERRDFFKKASASTLLLSSTPLFLPETGTFNTSNWSIIESTRTRRVSDYIFNKFPQFGKTRNKTDYQLIDGIINPYIKVFVMQSYFDDSLKEYNHSLCIKPQILIQDKGVFNKIIQKSDYVETMHRHKELYANSFICIGLFPNGIVEVTSIFIKYRFDGTTFPFDKENDLSITKAFLLDTPIMSYTQAHKNNYEKLL